MTSRAKQTALLAGCSAIFLAYLAYLVGVLHFEMMRSDVLAYWKGSYGWMRPYSVWWVPGYPWAIALVRAATFDSLPPLVVMLAISGVALLAGALIIYRIGLDLKSGSAMAFALLFILFPVVGLNYTVYPYADGPGIALLLLSFYFYLRENWSALTVALAATVLTHKATWYFVFPLVLMVFIRHKQSRKVLPLFALPLVLLIVAGSFFHHDILWFMRWSSENLLASRSTVPVLDGLIGPFLVGGTAKMLKGVLVLLVFFSGVGMLRYCYTGKFWLGFVVSCGIVLMGLSVNHYEIMALLRFGKVICVALPFLPAGAEGYPLMARLLRPKVFGAILLLALVSNLLFGYYMAKIFFTS